MFDATTGYGDCNHLGWSIQILSSP
jgi:hypothetical protein